MTIADLLIQNVQWNGIKIDSETGVQRVTIHNCVLHNVWQRGIKGVTVPEANRERLRPRDFRIEYCFFINDRPKRFGDDPADTAQSFGGDYIGGIDVMFASGWTISDNVFVGIHGRTASAAQSSLARLPRLRRRAQRGGGLRQRYLPGELVQAARDRLPLHERPGPQ